MGKLILSEKISQELLERYKEKLEYKGITSELYGVVGNWLISNEGDLLYYCENDDSNNALYPIYSYQHNEQDWISHLRTRVWFSEIVQDDFQIAFETSKNLTLQNSKQ